MPKKATTILIDSLKGKTTQPLLPYLGRKKRWEQDHNEQDKNIKKSENK